MSQCCQQIPWSFCQQHFPFKSWVYIWPSGIYCNIILELSKKKASNGKQVGDCSTNELFWVQVEAGFKRVIFFAFFINEELLGSNINKLH